MSVIAEPGVRFGRLVDSSGYRRCRLCTRAKQQAWKDKQREATP